MPARASIDKEEERKRLDNDTELVPGANRRWYHRLQGDWASVLLLLFLYMLQGLPLGLIASVPLLLEESMKNGTGTYKLQAALKPATWPFK
jgi:PAT family acetyl-CoA transporter-like MFS transporter 1